MKSLESIGHALSLDKEQQEARMPGAFVGYAPVKRKSSHIELAASEGVIKKEKHRRPEKAIYEFFTLQAWHDLLEFYSKSNNHGLVLRAPAPIGLCDLTGDKPTVFMEFIPGYELKKLCALRRTTPVKIKGQELPLPLYPACALHLGALNSVKEAEGLVHADYDARHLKFSPVDDICMGVVDLENSRLDGQEIVRAESDKIWSQFDSMTSSPRDKQILDAWYSQGSQSVNFVEGGYMGRVLEGIKSRFGVDLDMGNLKVNGVSVRQF